MSSEIQNEFDPEERGDFPIYDRHSQRRRFRSREAKIVGVEGKHIFDENPFLQVSYGMLNLEGYSEILPAFIASDQEFVLHFSSRAATDERFARRTLLDFDFQAARDKPPFEIEHGIKLCLVAQWDVVFTPSLNRSGSSSGSSTPGEHKSGWVGKTVYALILEPTHQKGHYKRVGVAEIPDEKFKIEYWEVEIATIV